MAERINLYTNNGEQPFAFAEKFEEKGVERWNVQFPRSSGVSASLYGVFSIFANYLSREGIDDFTITRSKVA